MEECAICLGQLCEKDSICNLPGCKHTFHTSCILSNVQYDTRCPICRIDIPNVVAKKDDEKVDEIVSIDELCAEYREKNRSYQRKRLRILKKNEKMLKKYNKMKLEEKCLKTLEKEIDKLWDTKTNDLWKNDSDLSVLKKKLEKQKTKFRTLKKNVSEYVEEQIGPKPEIDINFSNIFELFSN